MVRPLRSTGVTPLPRYYGPVRLPLTPPTWLLVPTPASWHDPDAGDLSGSSIPLSVCGVVLHPGCPDGCSLLLVPSASDPCHLRKVGRSPVSVTRPYQTFTRVTAHTFAVWSATSFASVQKDPTPAMLPRLGLPLDDWPQLHVEQAIYMADSFHSARGIRLILTHRRTRRTRRMEFDELSDQTLHPLSPSCSSCPSWCNDQAELRLAGI